MRPRDTSPEAWKILMDLMRQMTPAQKLQRAFELSEAMRQARMAGLREAHPNATEREIFLRFAHENLGPELYSKVYGTELVLDGRIQQHSN